jgi:hypothetical protein
MASTIIGHEVSNPAAFGWQWVTPDSGTVCQLVLTRAWVTEGQRMTLGMRVGERWTSVPVSAPERFTNGETVRTRAAWRDVVARWFAAQAD